MDYRFRRFLMLVPLFLMMWACATAPVNQPPSPEHVATAKRFLHSWNAGEVAMIAFRHKMESDSKQQPGMVELTQRAFSDVRAEDFEDLAAQVYARHLTQEHLASLARFAESRTGNRFFRAAVASALNSSSTKTPRDAMRQFNADELIEIGKFAQSDAFSTWKQALPVINREMAQAGQQFGQAKMREYLKRQ